MKKGVIYLLLLTMFFSCDSPIIEKIEDKYPNKEPKLVSYYKSEDGKEIKVEEQHFHENGQLKMSGKFLNGKRDGEWNAYFADGKIQSQGAFKEGKRNGLAKVYFPNGQLRYEGQYENNKEIGHWKFYNEEGKLIDEKDF